MSQQLSIASVLPLPSGNERYLWRTAPQSAFEAWLRTHKYVPVVTDGNKRALPPRLFSAHTQKSYAALFGQFMAFLTARQVHVVDATPRDLAEFLDALPGRVEGKASLVTRRRALNVLDNAYTQIVKLALRRDHPVKPLIGTAYTPTEVSPHSTVLLPSQHEAVLAYIDALPRDTFEGARRAALLAVAIGCGVCGDELRRIRLKQLALGEATPLLTMPACGLRTEVSLPLSDRTARILDEWCQVRAAAGAGGELLFPAAANRDEPVGLQTLHRYAVAALKAAGRTERTGAQRVLRASFAARQLAHGDDDQVRRWLRLRSDKMIERYKRHAVSPDQRIR